MTAPSWMLPLPVSDPARLAISLCMQCGNVVPAPTTNELPQPLAPSVKLSCCWANAANWLPPPYCWYSALVMYKPERVRRGVAVAQLRAELERVLPRLAQLSPSRSCAARSASSACRVISPEPACSAGPALPAAHQPRPRPAAPAAARPRRSRRCRTGSACHRRPGCPCAM